MIVTKNRPDRNAVATACIVCLTLGSAFSCATGVDVSDEELAELYAQSMTGGRAPSMVGGNGGTSVIGGNGGTSVGNGGGGASLGGIGGSSSGSGGTSASTGGAGGTTVPINPGVACGAPAPIASGGCANETSPTVVYTDRSDSPSFNQLTMALTVENVGAGVGLQDLILRYWFAADQGQTDFVAEIDYAEVGKENVCVSFGNQLGQSFADIAFSGGALSSDGRVRDVQVRLHTPNYAQQDQGNDFSFLAGADQAANENITVYVAGTRVSGCEP